MHAESPLSELVKWAAAEEPSAPPEHLRAALRQLLSRESKRESCEDRETEEEGGSRSTLRQLVLTCLLELLLLVLVAPIGIFLLLLPIGGLLAWMEQWQWYTGVFYIISVVCGLAQPLATASNVSPLSPGAKAACCLTGLWSLGLTAAIAALAGSHSESVRLLKDGCRQLVVRTSCVSPEVAKHYSIFPFLLCALAISPMLIFVAAFIASTLMMWIDYGPAGAGTGLDSTMFYFLADVGGLPNPLVDWMPTSVAGPIFADIYFSLVLYTFSSVCLGASQELLPGDLHSLLCRAVVPFRYVEKSAARRIKGSRRLRNSLRAIRVKN